MQIVRVDDVLGKYGLKPPVLAALVPDVNNYSVLLFQPQGVIEADPSGVRNRDRGKAARLFSNFIDKALDANADLVVTPEYSLPWSVLVDSLIAGKRPANGKLWALGCESITHAELEGVKVRLAEITKVISEPVDCAGERFLDPLVYVFTTKSREDDSDRVVLLMQLKTHPMGDAGHFENSHLHCGSLVYQFGGAQGQLRLTTLICSDAFGVTEADAKQIYDDALVLHIQLNGKPRQHQYRHYRELLFRYAGDTTELLCLNWAAGVCEWSGGNEKAWKNPSSSAWYLRRDELDLSETTQSANHRCGFYYTWLHTARAHVLFLNFDAGVYLLEATKVAHKGVPVSVSRRVGPKLRRVYRWDEPTGALADQPAAMDGFASILEEAGAARPDLERIYADSPLAVERVLALCAGKIQSGETWHELTSLDSFAIDPSEVIRRLTFCQDADPDVQQFRLARLKRCSNLWQILLDKDNLPPALSDVANGFRLDWHRARPHQNLTSSAGRAATTIYLGEEATIAQVDAVSRKIGEYLRRAAANDDDAMRARQRVALWYRHAGQIVRHETDRYLRFDEPRTGSELDLTRTT